MIPNQVHMAHFGSVPGPDVIWNQGSFWSKGHPAQMWNEDAVFDEFGIDVAALLLSVGTWASVANIIRLEILYKLGGIWMDTDVECIRPLNSLLNHAAFISKQPDGVFCNACMGAEAGHPWIKWQLEILNALQSKNDASFACHALKDSPMEGVTILPTDTFYPYGFDQDPKPPTENTLAIHKWAGSWVTK